VTSIEDGQTYLLRVPPPRPIAGAIYRRTHPGAAPEIYGAEHLLASRASTPAVTGALFDKITWWQQYTAMHGGSMDNNPSPGNKDGGLTSIPEKPLVATAHGGIRPLRQVVGHAERPCALAPITIDTPVRDPVYVAGIRRWRCAGLMCFTTGRGSGIRVQAGAHFEGRATSGLVLRNLRG
jgi:altronate dehydratase